MTAPASLMVTSNFGQWHLTIIIALSHGGQRFAKPPFIPHLFVTGMKHPLDTVVNNEHTEKYWGTWQNSANIPCYCQKLFSVAKQTRVAEIVAGESLMWAEGRQRQRSQLEAGSTTHAAVIIQSVWYPVVLCIAGSCGCNHRLQNRVGKMCKNKDTRCQS